MAAALHSTRVALCGVGWAGKVHTLAAASLDGVSIPVVAATSIGSVEEFASTIGAKPVNVTKLAGRTDAVIIATPPSSHAEIAVGLIEAATPVLIEKPLAATPAEADLIVAAAEANNIVACYAENLLFAPAVDLAVHRRGSIGPLEHLEVRMTQPAPDWGHFTDPLTIGGTLYDLGAHAVALALLLAGEEPVGIRSRLESHRPDGADDIAHVEIRFESGLICTVDVSWGGVDTEWSAQASSSSGVVRLELQPHVAVEVNGDEISLPALDSQIDPRVIQLGFRAQLDGFCSVLERKGGRVCPVGFGRTVLELICAAYQSAANNSEEIALPYEGPRDLTPLQLWRGA